jgi:methyl-accepting chemotaxis protein
MSLKWKLTLGVLVVLLLVGGSLTFIIQQMLWNIDQQLFEAIKQRAVTNAKAVESEIAYEMAARLPDEVTAKLSGFLTMHQEAHSIYILETDGRVFSENGASVDVERLTAGFKGLDRTTSRLDEDLKLIVATTPIKGDEGVLGAVIYTESLAGYYSFRASTVQIAFISSLLGFVLIIVSAYLIGRSTAKPFDELVSTAERIASGDLRYLKVETRGSLETRRMALSIKSMALALQKQVVAIKSLTTEISGAAREVADNMFQLANSASEQAAAVSETAATVEEMETTGKNTAGNAKQIVDVAEKTAEASVRGQGAVETTNEMILRITENSQEVADKSINMLSAVEEVGNIIRSVNAIAEQSRILAVNASIEAAKAGEYGAGFAVVAQEVKDLAQQSKDATLQITGTLIAIRGAIENMVRISKSGKEHAEEGSDMIANAGAIMNDLSEAIRENSKMANTIAENIKQQTMGLTQIAISIEQINSSAFENQKISRINLDTVNKMSKSFDDLHTLVGHWQTPEGEDREDS